MLNVSLIMTTSNSRDNFIKSYESIRKQTYPKIEIVVVDGASTDGTSSSGLRAYLVSFKEGMRALQENEVRGALWITLCRIMKVIGQFRSLLK